MSIKIEETVFQTKNGDKKAEEILYNKCRKIIKLFLIKKYKNYDDIEDDVSEIIIKIHCNISKFNINESKFTTWIINIAKNYMYDKHKSNTNKLKFNTCSYTASFDLSIINHTESDCILLSTSNTTENTLISNDGYNFLSNSVSCADFNLLNMKYVSGYNYDEISCEMNYDSSAQAANKINYLKAKIKKKYKNEF